MLEAVLLSTPVWGFVLCTPVQAGACESRIKYAAGRKKGGAGAKTRQQAKTHFAKRSQTLASGIVTPIAVVVPNGVNHSGRVESGLADKDVHNGEAARIRRRLARLAAERETLEARLAELDASESPAPDGDWHGGSVTSQSPADEKIALFRSLFCGREDVFPKRWENSRTGKTGYALACGNDGVDAPSRRHRIVPRWWPVEPPEEGGIHGGSYHHRDRLGEKQLSAARGAG